MKERPLLFTWLYLNTTTTTTTTTTFKKKRKKAAVATCLEMRLTAPLAVRGGKNSRENQASPDSVLRRILSRRRSERSASGPGVEQRELSLELSPPLVLLLAPLESLLLVCQLPSTRWTWFTMVAARGALLGRDDDDDDDVGICVLNGEKTTHGHCLRFRCYAQRRNDVEKTHGVTSVCLAPLKDEMNDNYPFSRGPAAVERVFLAVYPRSRSLLPAAAGWDRSGGRPPEPRCTPAAIPPWNVSSGCATLAHKHRQASRQPAKIKSLFFFCVTIFFVFRIDPCTLWVGNISAC